MKVQIVTTYRVSHLQRYGVTVRGNVTSVYPPLRIEDGSNMFLRNDGVFIPDNTRNSLRKEDGRTK
jgi:hypothetical protein